MTGIRILYLEDNPLDVEIVRNVFEEEKIDIELKDVKSKSNFTEALNSFAPDIILADFSLPSFDGLEALELVRSHQQDIPFIFISGVMGEELAIEVLKSGATDYILKQKMGRLVPIVRRALLETKEKAKRIHAEKLKNKYDFIVNASRSMFTLVDKDYTYEAVNDAFCKAHNLIREEIIGRSLEDLWGPEVFKTYIKKNFDQCFTDNIVRYQSWFEVPYHGLRCFEVTFYPYKEHGSEVTHTVVDTMDITDRQKAEDALRDSEARYRMLFDRASEAILLVRDGKIQTCNAKTMEFFRETKGEILNHSLLDFSPERQPDEESSRTKLEHYMSQVTNGDSIHFEWVIERPDQTIMEANINLTCFTLNEEKFYQFFIDDITEAKHAMAQQELLYAAIEHSAEMVIITDNDGMIEYCNQAFQKITGYQEDEIAGKSHEIFYTDENAESFYLNISKKLHSGKIWRGKSTIRHKQGRVIEVYSSITPIFNAQGVLTKFVIVQRDITEESKLQGYVRRAQRMETVGTLAGGIAHDFNNILATIIGHTDIAMQDVDSKHRAYHDLEQIMKAANRAKELINQIMAFSRQDDEKAVPINMSARIQEAVEILGGPVLGNIEISMELDKSCPFVIADPSKINQVIMNICTNGIYAMREDGGVLNIHLHCIELDRKHSEQFPDLKAGRYVQATFTDHGKGMEEGIIDRIFEPFFTTKPVGEGTGLGLSVVHGIIKSLDGEIVVENTPGEGSAFKILIPAIEEK
jgi:PAS domain S-box-containing protein